MMDAKFEDLNGKIITSIIGGVGDDEIKITLSDNSVYKMYHVQDCCEDVRVDDIVGDINDLLNSPVTMAEEITSNTNPEGIVIEYQDSFTWTFYKLATIKGYVTIRWYGESNGYYSEDVEFVKVEPSN